MDCARWSSASRRRGFAAKRTSPASSPKSTRATRCRRASRGFPHRVRTADCRVWMSVASACPARCVATVRRQDAGHKRSVRAVPDAHPDRSAPRCPASTRRGLFDGSCGASPPRQGPAARLFSPRSRNTGGQVVRQEHPNQTPTGRVTPSAPVRAAADQAQAVKRPLRGCPVVVRRVPVSARRLRVPDALRSHLAAVQRPPCSQSPSHPVEKAPPERAHDAVLEELGHVAPARPLVAVLRLALETLRMGLNPQVAVVRRPAPLVPVRTVMLWWRNNTSPVRTPANDAGEALAVPEGRRSPRAVSRKTALREQRPACPGVETRRLCLAVRRGASQTRPKDDVPIARTPTSRCTPPASARPFGVRA